MFHADGAEGADLSAGAAGDAQALLHLADITGRYDHGDAVALGFHCPAAGTAVANGIKAPEDGVLEESVVSVPALVLFDEDALGFR